MEEMLKRYLIKHDKDQLEIRRTYLTDPHLVPVGAIMNGSRKDEQTEIVEEVEKENLSDIDEDLFTLTETAKNLKSQARIYTKAEICPEIEREEQDDELQKNIAEIIPYSKLEHLKTRNDVLGDIYGHTERRVICNQEKLIQLQRSNIDTKIQSKELEPAVERITDLDFKFSLNHQPETLQH